MNLDPDLTPCMEIHGNGSKGLNTRVKLLEECTFHDLELNTAIPM